MGCEDNRDAIFIAGSKTTILYIPANSKIFYLDAQASINVPAIEREVTTKTPCPSDIGG